MFKDLFRKAAKAGTFRTAGTPRPKARRRKSRDDTRAAFPKASQTLAARAGGAYVGASIFMSATLDWLHLWQHEQTPGSGDHAAGLNAATNHLSPHL